MAPGDGRFLIKTALRATLCVAVGLALYVGGYVGLMRRDVPAVDGNGHIAYRSSFRLAPLQRVNGPLSIYGPAVSPLNMFFEPIDDYWRRMGGCIRVIPENGPFADGLLDPARIQEIKVYLSPPRMLRPDTYEDLKKCRCLRIPPHGATQELCAALRGAHSSPGKLLGGPTAQGVIEAVIDGGRSVYLYFHVHEADSDVYVYPLDMPAREPMAKARWQSTLLPWLRKYVLQGEAPQSAEVRPADDREKRRTAE
jgi:hypothetical protein